MGKQLRDKRRGPLLQANGFFPAASWHGDNSQKLHAGAPFLSDEPHCMQAKPLLEDLFANKVRVSQKSCRLCAEKGRWSLNHHP